MGYFAGGPLSSIGYLSLNIFITILLSLNVQSRFNIELNCIKFHIEDHSF